MSLYLDFKYLQCDVLSNMISTYCLDAYASQLWTGQVGLGVWSWPSNRATEGSNPKGTRL